MKHVWGIPIVGSLFLLCLSSRCVQSKVYEKWGMVDEHTPGLISDGKQVDKAEAYPWHVAILLWNKLHGGGSIISERYVITVSHVTYSYEQELQPSDLTIIAGTISLLSRTKTFTVKEIIRFPGYDKKIYLHDICLLKVNGTIIYSRIIKPVRLWDISDKAMASRENIKQVIVGFGLTEHKQPSKVLKKADIQRVEKEDCITNAQRFKPLLEKDVSFCAKGINATVCTGDSGGGSVYFSEGRQVYYLTGLVSQGQWQGENCAPAKETLYTDIEYYSKWIEQRAVPKQYNLLGIPECDSLTKNEKSQSVLQGLVHLKYAFRKSLFVSDCHGVLITRKHVLTQASCVVNKTRILHAVAVGSSAIGNHSEPSKQYKIDDIIQKKEIAIITLVEEVDPSIKPVCLPTRRENGNQTIIFWKREVKHPKYTQHGKIQQQKTSLAEISANDLLGMHLQDIDLDNERLGSSPLLYEVNCPIKSHVYLRALEKCPIHGCGEGRRASFIDILGYVEWIRDTLDSYIGNEWLSAPLYV